MASTTLPSFVELMASLGLDSKPASASNLTTSSLSTTSGTSNQNHLHSTGPTRSRSTPSLRDHTVPRSKGVRYSPYSPTFAGARRASVSSSSPSPEIERRSLRSHSTSPQPPRKPDDDKMKVDAFDSSTDLSANTPISSFVRRKTPGTSPTSPAFPLEPRPECSVTPMPLLIPTLPLLFPTSTDQQSSPDTPESDLDRNSSSEESPFTNNETEGMYSFLMRCHRHTGLRVSRPRRHKGFKGKYANQQIVRVI